MLPASLRLRRFVACYRPPPRPYSPWPLFPAPPQSGPTPAPVAESREEDRTLRDSRDRLARKAPAIPPAASCLRAPPPPAFAPRQEQMEPPWQIPAQRPDVLHSSA